MDKRRILTVSQLNTYIAGTLERDPMLFSLLVRGEVTNLSRSRTGHVYFDLKDEQALVHCTLWRSQVSKIKTPFKNGDQVLVAGRISVYQKGGTYNLNVQEILPEGIGSARARYEQIYRELKEEGYFDPRYKKPIPTYATRIGVVTSATGAAITDIDRHYHARNPYVSVFLYPALVQGETAKYSIINGIRYLDGYGVDVIIVGRGGGSEEDLSVFNDPDIAKAIFQCQTPVISAVGHERDRVITDDVADLSCNVPSAGADAAIFDIHEFDRRLNLYQDALDVRWNHRIQVVKSRMAYYREYLRGRSPSALINEERHRADDLAQKMDLLMSRRIEALRRQAERAANLELLMQNQLTAKRNRLNLLVERFKGLNPLEKLTHGYSYVSDQSLRAVTKIDQVEVGDQLTVHVTDGTILAEVKETKADG
jgi:exodeoxyribonuclease VII large subunit